MKKQLTTFQKCLNIQSQILQRATSALCYNWSNEFKLSNLLEVKDVVERWQEKGQSYKINPNDLSTYQMRVLGFSKWDKKSKLMLIPFWLYPFLADEFECTSISGSKHTKLSEIDNDQRFGFLAYGVIK